MENKNATRNTCPFKVGQLGEWKSFLKGYRGSWFQCEIKGISLRKGEIGTALHFIDFPEEKIRWTKLYQKPPVVSCKSKEIERQIMVRLSFPPIFRESEMPDSSSITEVTVIVDDVWKVGDLVDWVYDGCYWSGKLTKLLDNEMAKILPLGKDNLMMCHARTCAHPLIDLVQHGWTLPVDEICLSMCPSLFIASSFWSKIMEGENVRNCARIVLPANHSKIEEEGGGSLKESIGKTSCCDRVSSSVVRDHEDSMDATASKKEPDEEGCSKKMRTSERKPFTFDSDSVDAAIVQLEDFANKVEWL